MYNKLNEKNIMILGDLTHKLDMLKKDSYSYDKEDFEKEFNEIKDLFEVNKLPFKYDFETFSSSLEFKNLDEDQNKYEDESYEESYDSSYDSSYEED